MNENDVTIHNLSIARLFIILLNEFALTWKWMHCIHQPAKKMATIQTEDASDRLHLSLLSSPKDHDNPNNGVYSYREGALGEGTWIVIINTGYNWEQFPKVSQKNSVWPDTHTIVEAIGNYAARTG